MRSSFLFLFAITGWLLACAQSEDAISKIEFTKVSRGFQFESAFTPDSVIITEHNFRGSQREPVRRKISKSEWNSLTRALENIKPESLGSLESPTNQRQFDGAAIGTVTITTVDGNSFSHGFDDDQPNLELQPLIDAIKSIIR